MLSVDAVGAFDHVSRGAMLGALHARPQLQPLLPFARQFYAAPSTYTWYDEADRAHVICQGEGGEQGDPLMPALYALAQHEALCDLQSQLRDGEAVFAFLDDTYIVAAPERVRTLYDALASALWDRARIRLHQGKTRIWNAAGEEPPDIADLGEGEESVWVGDWTLPPESQGLTALGSPLGSRNVGFSKDGEPYLLPKPKRYPLRRPDPTDVATTMTGSWRASPPSTTSRQRGCCCASAPPRAPTTFCEPFLLTSRLTSQRSTMQQSLGALPRSWSKATPPCPPPASTQLSWPSALGGSVSAPPGKTASQRVGPPGATPSPSS